MTISPDRYNFSVWKGSTFRRILTFHTSDEASDPRDLTGYTASMPIKSNGVIVKTLSTGSGITLGGTAGTITLFISDEDTAAATWNVGSYSLFLTGPSGDTDTLLFGNFSIKGT